MSTRSSAIKHDEQADGLTRSAFNLGPITWTAIAISLLLVVSIYLRIFRWWYVEWGAKESYYSHAYAVPFISGFLVWLKRKKLAEIGFQPSAVGFLFLIPVLMLVVFGYWLGPESIIGLTFPLMLAGLVWVLLGNQAIRETWFPIGYLYFMCVLPGAFIVPLAFKIQVLSTIGATTALRLVGLDAVRNGVYIQLPEVMVKVGAPCSGFRLLISMIAIVVLLIYLVDGPLWGKLVLLASALPLSILLNSFRITLVGLVGEQWGSDAMHSFHDYSGYIMLVLQFFVLILLARLVKCREFNFTP